MTVPDVCQQDGCGPEYCPGGSACRGDLLKKPNIPSECPRCGRGILYEEGSAGVVYAYCPAGDWVEP